MNQANAVEVVRNFVLSSGATDGGRLPTERSLVTTLRMPRSAIRNALLVLEAEGLVVRKVGSGTYLAGPVPAKAPQPAAASASLDVNPKQIMEARLALEPQIAALAAVNCTRSDLDHLIACAEEYHRADDFEAFEAADEKFHHAIAAATHNPLVISAWQSFSAAQAAAEWGGLRQHFLTGERRARSREEHDRILGAIRQRDASAASKAVRDHLHHIVADILQQQ
jgi:DNA-binding FadR family transcriptional regulator